MSLVNAERDPLTPMQIADERISQCVRGISLGNADYLRTSLLLIQDLDEQNPENMEWTQAWISHGAVEVAVSSACLAFVRFA